MLDWDTFPIPSKAKVVLVVVSELSLAQLSEALGWLLDGH